MYRLDLKEPFAALWAGKDPFQEASALEGQVFRTVKNRQTFRFEEGGRGFFMKLHRGVGWKEIIKNLLQGKRPVLGAGNEYDAIQRFHAAGIDTMTAVAFGEKGRDPANRLSFLVTEELTDVITLEDLCRSWAKEPPEDAVRHKLIRALAERAGKMHRLGINHRDCYLCHFMLKQETLKNPAPTLYVIDLHRAQIRKRVPLRYLVKDLAGLWFSAMDIGLRKRDLLRFWSIYCACNETCPGGIIRRVRRAAERLYRKEFHRDVPPLQ